MDDFYDDDDCYDMEDDEEDDEQVILTSAICRKLERFDSFKNISCHRTFYITHVRFLLKIQQSEFF